MKPIRRILWGDESGASAAEFAVVILLFSVLVFGIIDFSRLAWQYNMLEKAAQKGARFAVVNAMVAPDLWDYDGVADGGATAGDPVAISQINGGNPIVCSASGGSVSCNPNAFGEDQVAFDAIVARTVAMAPNLITANEVVVEYQHIGLGIAGNPLSSDITPSVTIRLQNMTFNFITPGLSGLVTLNFPDFATTLTGEFYGT